MDGDQPCGNIARLVIEPDIANGAATAPAGPTTYDPERLPLTELGQRSRMGGRIALRIRAFRPCRLSTESGAAAVARYRSMLGKRAQSAPTDAPTRSGLIPAPMRSFRSRRRSFPCKAKAAPGEGSQVRRSYAKGETREILRPAHDASQLDGIPENSRGLSSLNNL
jgi:hypothetical protein